MMVFVMARAYGKRSLLRTEFLVNDNVERPAFLLLPPALQAKLIEFLYESQVHAEAS
jgi:hypothetical protein